MITLVFADWTAAFSEASDGDLRVSARTPGEPLATVQARVLASLAVAAIAVPRQVHGVDVVSVTQPLSGYRVGIGDGDGVVSSFPGVAAAVHVADCLPIVLGGGGAVAALHGGWRGLAGGIVGEGIRALRARMPSPEAPLHAVIGPGVGGCCYETGDEVRAQFARFDASRGRLLDLKAVAATQLREAGVALVTDVELCTICSAPGRLFSHRRDGPATGRQGGFAWH